MNKPILKNATARRLFLDRHLLLRPQSGTGKGADLAGLLNDLGFVQVDSVNTLARAHDLILWSRRGQYRPPALGNLVARARAGFEHWTHDAAVIPMQFFPMWRLKFERDEVQMQKQWPNWRRDGWEAQFDAVLDRISKHGPTCSSDVGTDEKKGSSGWWDWHPSKTALEFLWRSGRLSICHREGFRKFYDLTERVIPSELRETHLTNQEIVDWACSAALDRLGFATSGELKAFFDVVTPQEARDWVASALADGRVEEVDVEDTTGKLRRSVMWPGTMDAALPAPTNRVRLLSPFDPALRDRKRAERLFGFHYRIEIFVPAPKRQYGYYVFPVMQGDRLIGRIDCKREGSTLKVTAFWPEAGIAMGQGRQSALTAELGRVARLASCDEVTYTEGWLKEKT